MNETQALETAKTMFLQDSRRKEVLDFFIQNGLTEEKAEAIANSAYQSIKAERKVLMKEQEKEAGKIGWKSLLLGAVLLIGSIIILFTTGSFYYVVALGGLVLIINGFSKTFDF